MNTDNTAALVFAVLGNGLNLAYNIPFVYTVWKKRSSKNISGTFLLLRFYGSISWLIYAILVMDAWVGISYVVTLSATCMIYYIKFKERNNIKKPKSISKVSSEIDCDSDLEENIESNEEREKNEIQEGITIVVKSSTV